jgi:hypothetical protein
MNFRVFAHSVFSGLSRLYPEEYKQKYSEEMKSVFQDILDDSENSGGRYVVRS